VEALVGGVSSDIVRVDLCSGRVCVKRARERLRVAKDWRAPLSRNAYEVAWMKVVGRIAPRAVPQWLGEDRNAALFVMSYLPPEQYPLWKWQLRDGVIAPSVAQSLGKLLALIHGVTANDPAMESIFSGSSANFYALRLEPYFLTTAAAHPDCANELLALTLRTSTTRLALVHGDVSPKNILVGPDGPVLLDAEACCYGDPAFDVAFCMTHLLLKCVWRSAWCQCYLACFDELAATYLRYVTWESVRQIETRIAMLVPALLLARVDGKSPVEYLETEEQKQMVRTVAKRLLLHSPCDLAELRDAWLVGVAN